MRPITTETVTARLLRSGVAPAVVFSLSVMATVLASYLVSTTIRSNDLTRFQSAVRWTTAVIEQRLNGYVTLLVGGAGLFAVQATPTAAEFKAYTERLRIQTNYPGVQGVGFAIRVRQREREEYINSLREGGRTTFEIKPPGEREEYFPILYLEPLDTRNQAALGYDMFSEQVRHEAMARARDEGQVAASGRVRLVQEIEDWNVQAGFLIYVPVYQGGAIPGDLEARREKLFGFVYSPFRADDLFAGIFAAEREPDLHFSVHDGMSGSAETLLHSSRLLPAVPPQFTAQTVIFIGGRPWLLRFSSTRPFEADSNHRLVPWVFASGLVFSLILGLFTVALVRSQRQLQFAQAELKAYADSLESVVAERTAKLRDMVDELEHMSYSITHDMRAPLRAIQSFGTVLQEDAGPMLSPESRDYLERMRSAAGRMDALIRDVLNYGQLVRSDLPLHRLEPSPFLRSIIETYPAFHSPAARIDVQPDMPAVLANEAALTQCLSNLLGNAVKFVKPAQTPEIQVSASRTEDGFIRISVRDNGIGIAPEMQAKLFRMFQRLNPAYEGTGIGLAIVRKAAERMGGRVGLTSAPGQGSTFWIELRPA